MYKYPLCLLPAFRRTTLQCSHLFFTELCTFIPLVCCIDPPSVRLVVAVQALLKTECTQLGAEAVRNRFFVAGPPTEGFEAIILAGRARVRGSRSEAMTACCVLVQGFIVLRRRVRGAWVVLGNIFRSRGGDSSSACFQFSQATLANIYCS